MIMEFLAIVVGLILLIWSADKFVEGASTVADNLGLSPLVIGMVIVGFGTSAPELAVSVLASIDGNPGVALGNAYGSNIANIALILGVTAAISPIAVRSEVVRRELPLLAFVTILAVILYWDQMLTRANAAILLVLFFAIMTWTIWQARAHPKDILASEVKKELKEHQASNAVALFWVVTGVLLLVLSSRMLVWGAVSVAQQFGVSDLVIGLTIVAIGTSLPELASSIAAARKGEHDMALGNILGSNMFNTLAVVGLAGVISPTTVERDLLTRDLPVLGGLTLLLFFMSFGFAGRPARINRLEGVVLTCLFVGYTSWLIYTQLPAPIK